MGQSVWKDGRRSKKGALTDHEKRKKNQTLHVGGDGGMRDDFSLHRRKIISTQTVGAILAR